jgi:iron complex transport system substrate-binding protein
MHGFRRFTALTCASLALFAGAAGCSSIRLPGDGQDAPAAPTDDPASGFPAQVELAGQPPVTITEQPKRIVSLSPSATSTLFAVGAGKQVRAVSSDSTAPAQAPRTDLTASSGPDAVLAQKPDLVIAPDSAGPLADQLRAKDVPVLLVPVPPDLEAAYGQVETLGHATGHGNAARALADRMRAQIGAIAASAPKPATPTTYFHEARPDGTTVAAHSYLGSLYGMFGLNDVAQDEGRVPAEKVRRDNPDLVFLADGSCCQVTPESAASRPGWSGMAAVRHHHVYPVDDQQAERWGPGLVTFAQSISDALKTGQRP